MKETRFNIGMNTLKQIDGLHGEEVYNTIQEDFTGHSRFIGRAVRRHLHAPQPGFQGTGTDYARIPVNAGRLRGTAESTHQCGTQCRYCARANRRDLYPLHPLCGISTRAERTVYGEGGL